MFEHVTPKAFFFYFTTKLCNTHILGPFFLFFLFFQPFSCVVTTLFPWVDVCASLDCSCIYFVHALIQHLTLFSSNRLLKKPCWFQFWSAFKRSKKESNDNSQQLSTHRFTSTKTKNNIYCFYLLWFFSRGQRLALKTLRNSWSRAADTKHFLRQAPWTMLTESVERARCDDRATAVDACGMVFTAT